ncbi:LacI family DNA-binding transcriptional regulator [Plantactinospora sp. KBS50]|uniref:LacI family DNA-binding transcriptional regulator n=1 Tax=Plantactinospora sp. KBS50 TaxID=2024580 RepID=UPI000BAAB817|nr:LacI family DNA-binding transcriptional regulator [Plantactinospora sp. KBS50]ASW57767.1 LacI family transcriptional regulator [Plantactinospora sp. KBS50]
MARRATVRQLAAETGLSVATVSRALNGHANVAEHTREAVLQAVGRLGRRAPSRRTDRATVYVRCPYLLTDYFGIIVSSIVETVELHDMDVLLNAGRAARDQVVLPTLPVRSSVDGAVLILPPEPAEDLAALRDAGFPFVVVDPRVPPPRDIAAVSAAHVSGARAVMDHLVRLGHRRVGIIGGPRDWLVTNARMTGYTAPLADVGVLPSPDLVCFVSDPTMEQGYQAARELLDRPDRPTALVGFNDKIAVGALHAARERGLRVPADLSVVGFDDSEIGRATDPVLTTVRQPLAELGRMAVTLLLRQLRGHELDALHVELATELVERASTAPAATGP